ncbi:MULTISPECIES: Na/Pi cotransporter family protein [Nitratireductor]|uniref:Na/Pi cotransporter family protein n=1 Tax=Nitratireductor TaxID=245876 RepID=UPI0019D3F08D|nr:MULTISPECIES: Na/Pi cotransporter family protein [Nitratireductor]MBN7776100.1 Na/Pi cotransporter family protein [Nitratireductor pacificus]MBN7778967.1 Na/Pi cotransporter family protein [Nitratireductor pacificus]MBN7787774.1 Na/Pi cotransporter family protein [Nitratireductor aquimarinus]MBY6097821.1 Na/Pi cotransporter family protein [Nitratireductor aquimarinus]MCV0378647.1 Na/Pi cotransporter family protein [Nitratireductor sp.]
MSGSVFFLHMAGAVALLLWATRMVRTGVERAYGNVLRQRLRQTLGNPVLAALTGLLLSIALQSSTAVTLLVGSFAGLGIVTGLSGILAVRGAEVGSALVVKILSFDLTLLVPLCLLFGTSIFLATERRQWRQFGRILVGVGLLILSLEMMGEASEPLRQSTIVPIIVGYLSSDPITAFLLAAVVTYLFHSSIAAVLLLTTFAARGIVSPELGIVMVLGVNLGSSFIAPMLTRSSPPAYRVVPLGNLLMRGLGSVVLLVAFIVFAPTLEQLGSDPADRIIHAHIAFNVLILIAGIPLSRLILKATEAIVALQSPPERDKEEEPLLAEASALDASALDNPHQALANVTRETVRMCETVEFMLCRILELYEKADRKSIDALAAVDDTVDRRHAAIKLYLARITRQDMTEEDSRRCQELLGVCVKLEQVGDIIVRNMLAHVEKKMERGVEFTEEGWRELASFHASVLANARLAFNLLVTQDTETARELVMEKDRLRDVEKETSQRHFERLRQGTEQSVETSSIHLDTIRDLKQINSLLATFAYPVLEERGLLSGSRLKPD